MRTTDDPKSATDLRVDPNHKERLLARGEWTLANVPSLSAKIDTLAQHASQLDASDISRLDASGAMLLDKLCAQTGQHISDAGLAKRWHTLFETVAAVSEQQLPADKAAPAWSRLLAGVGRSTVGFWQQSLLSINFLGMIVHRLGRSLLKPGRLRLTATVWHMQQTGLNAAPLLILLASLTGAVVAYLGATVLRDFGAEVFIIDLVTFAFLREFGVLLAAILLAGRTASAFCAQIGMMKTREELDAIRVLGLDEIEVLVLPRLIALMIVLPLLTFIATIAGLFGGLLVAVLSLDINLATFLDRMEQSVTLQHYLVGLLKAPVFAAVIALVGCLEGMRVSGSAQSVGEHTTSAVVRSLTLVIVLDGLAAIYFMEIGW